MVLAMVVAALLAGDSPARDAPRFHWEAAVSGTVLRGAGGHFELGIVLDDQHVFALRADVATIIVLGTYQVGVSVAEWLTDWFTLGVGGTFAFHNDFGESPFSVGAQFPVRATFLLNKRPDDQQARRGLTIGVEVSPGFWNRRPTVEGAGSGLSLMGTLSFGWASW